MKDNNFNKYFIQDVNDINILLSDYKGKTYKEIEEEKAKLRARAKERICQMTKSFDLNIFFNSQNDIMGIVIITPNQVATMYGDGRMFHNQLITIIMELITHKNNNNPIIIIRCAKKRKKNICIPMQIGKKRQISQEMNEILNSFYDELKKIDIELAKDFNNIRNEGIKFNRLLYTIEGKIGIANYESDKEIIGISIKKFIKNLTSKNEY